MAGLLFPDIAGALSSGAQAGAASAQGRFLMEDRAAKNEIAPLIPRALQGDKEALNQIGARHPDTFAKILPQLDRLDANKRAKVKEDAEFITSNGMAILSAPPEQQPQLYARVRQEAAAAGRDVSNWPTTYDPGWIKFNVDKARPFADYFKDRSEGFELVPSGGGAAPPAAGGGVNQYNIGNVRPVGGGPQSGFQQPATLDDGIRLAVNNVKAYPAKFNGGQPMTLLQIGERWAPRGDGANDPVQWARNVASIGGLDPNQPLDLNDPMIAAKFARGVHGAEHGANKVLPPERYAQAITGGAQPPGLAQGDAAPRGDASGNPIPTSDGGAVTPDTLRMVRPNLPPGAHLGFDKRTGKINAQDGNFIVYDGNKRPIGLVPIPKAPGADKGLFGDSLTGRALTALRSLPPDSQEYAAAYAILSKPQVVPDGAGGFTTIQPMNLSMFPKPSFAGGAFVEPPPAGGPAPTQVGGVTVQSIPGKGKPLDNSARKEITEASSGVLELTELVKSFDPSFGGFIFEQLGTADNLRKRNFSKDEKGQAQWWQRYQQFANLERNKLFGAALTPGEAAEFNKAMVNPGMKPDQIATNLTRQRDIATKALSRIVNSMVAGGYNAQAIEAATGIPVAELPSAMGGVPQAAPTLAPAPAPAPQQPAPQTPRGADRGKLLFDARAAIKEGAPRDKVIERLRSLGIEDEP